MRAQAYVQVQIARLSAVHAWATLSRETYGRTVTHSGGNIHLNRLRLQNLTRAAACWANLVVLYYAGSITSLTDFSHLHLQRATHASMRLFKRKLDFSFNVRAASASTSAPSACAGAAEHLLKNVEAARATGASEVAKIKIVEVKSTGLLTTP